MAEPVVPSTFVPNETLIHQNIQSDPAVKAQQIVDSAPHLAKEPQTVMALASHPTADGHTLASVAQLAQHVSAATRTVQQHAESDPKQSSAPHWWDSLSNAINDVSDKIVGGAQRGLNFVSDVTSLPRVPLNAVGDTLSNFVGDIPHLADQASTLVDPYLSLEKYMEGQSPSQILKKYVQSTDLVNPIAMFHNGRSTMAMYEMLKQTKGTAYANTWLSTNVALAVVTKKALGVGSAEGVSEEVSAEAAAAEKAAIKNDPKLIKDFEKRTANGETLTQAEKDAASQAQQRIDQRKVLADQENRMKADRQEKLRQQTKLRRGTAAVTKAVTLPIKPAFAALKFASKPGQDVTLNLMYEYAKMSSQGNPDMAKMWEQAQTGIVTDKYGRKVTAGQELAELFGATPGDMAFQMGGGAIDFYNKWLGTDALGATGKVIAESRTAGGFGSGLLSKWFNGLGMTNGDRVYQALQQYPRVGRAFEYMATHDRVDILRTFRGTFDYASPAGKAALEALGNAKSVEEVARIFADLAEGTGLVRNTVPTMTNYELLKATLPATKLFSGDASKLLSMDEHAIEEYQKATAGKTGWDFMPKNAAEAGSSDVGLRSRATFGRWLVKQFTRNAAFIDEITKKWSNSVIRPGSTTGLEAMADHLRAARLPERVIKAAIDSLIDAPPEDYVRLYRSVYFHAVARRFMAGASNAAADSLLVNGLSHIRDEVMRMTGSDGGSILGAYLAGPLGSDLSQIVEVGDSAFAGSTYFAGIGSTHLGELTLPNVSSLRGLSVQTNRIILNLTKPEANRLAKMLHLDLKTLENLSTFAKASLKGMEGTVSKLSGSRPDTSFTGDYSKTSALGYEQVINAYSKIIREASAETTIQENQQFVKTFDTLRKQLFQLREYISQHSEYRVAEGIVGDWNTPIGKQIIKELNARLPEGGIQDIRSLTPITLARLEGQEAALNDIASKFLERLRTPDFSFKEIRDHIAQYEETMGKAAVADKALAKELASKFERLQEKNSAFLNPWQKGVVGLNMLLSKTFVPMALGSGGWALRVSLSETILNTLRQGWGKSFESRVLTSIAKHESVSAVDFEKFAGKVLRNTDNSEKYVAGEWMTRKDETSLIFKTIAHALLGVREIAAGTALGIERNLVNLNDIGSQRMLDNFASAIIRHNGHLPLGVHDQGGDIYDDGLAHASKVYGIDKEGNPATDTVYRDRTFGHVNAGGKGYVTALFESLGRIHADPVLLPTMQTLARILDEKAVNELGAKAASVMTSEQRLKVGARYFTTEAEINQLTEQLELQAYDTIQRMNPEERARFARDHSTLKGPLSYSGTGKFPEAEVPHRDWAKVIAYHDLHMVMGIGKEGFMIHGSLVDQAATGELKAPAELAKDIKAIPRGAEPKNVPARQFIDRNWRKDGSAVNFLQIMSEKLHSGVLGPIVNTLARDPLFLLEYHNAYEALRPMLENNLITIEQAEVKADTAAIQNMSKYVHNPKDKTVFEANMRVAAPFYFAQNQAWRRALRVLRDDPGAFEKYLKLCLNITNHVSTSVANGMASMHIPGSQFMGAIGEFTSPLDSPFANLMFSLVADPGSVSSIAPTGAEGGWGMLGIARASWGPIVTIPVKLADKYFNLHNIPLANKIIETFLGPISSRTGIMSDAVPSPAIRNTVGLILHHNDTMASVTLEVMHNAADNLLTKYYNQTYNQIKDDPNMTHDQKVTLARSYAETEATKWMNDSANKQAFLDQAQTSATWMFVVKTVLSFGSPFALSLQSQFSKYSQFQQILTETNPLTKQKNTFEQAATIFIEKYPTALFDLVSVSNSPYVPYAETKSAVDLLTNHPEVANKYPYAAAYLIDRNAKHDSSAYSLEMSMNLRSRQSPENYYESFMNAAGQDFYYNNLKPQYDTNAPGQQGYKNYVELSNAAQNYGRFVNPIWYGNFKSGKGKYIAEANAFSEMETMLADPTVPDSLFGGKDERGTYNALIKKYQDTVIAYDNASSARERASIQNTWYDNITALSTAKSDDGELLFARQAYFMTSVLRNLPTKTQ